SPAAPVTGSSSRSTRIRAALAETFEELSGIDLSTADSATTFLEMGFDSLFLTQVTQALQSKFDVKITFRQLLGDQSTLAALAEFMEGRLAADAFAEPAAAQPTVEAPPVAPAEPMASASPSEQPT